MPAEPYKSDHRLTTPPRKDQTMTDIETLIHHFVHTTWGPAIPPGEVFCGVEATKGHKGYYLIADNSTHSYRTRIRKPSFTHMQFVTEISNGYTIADLMAIMGSVDSVLTDNDR